jgi:hypothetical protein
MLGWTLISNTHENELTCWTISTWNKSRGGSVTAWLDGWLFTVLRPAQEYFTYMETSPLSVKSCKILAYARRSGPLSREGSLSCHTCCDMGHRFFRSHPKDPPLHSESQYSSSELLLTRKFCTILWRSSAFYKCFLFVCFKPHEHAIFQLSGGCHHYRWQGCKFMPMLGTQGLWAGRDLYRSLSCHTYCDTGHRFIRSHPKDRHPRPTVGFEPPTQWSSDLCARHSNPSATRATSAFYIDKNDLLQRQNHL